MTTMLATAHVVKAKEDVIGVDVQNREKDDLGKICELVLDKLTGQVLYAVLESGTFLGMGGKLFAIPWQALKYDTECECFILNLNKEMIKQAPGFDKNNWPDMADNTWIESTARFYSGKNFMDKNL